MTPETFDKLKVLPRLMMLAVTVLTYQSVHWFMSIPPELVYKIKLVSDELEAARKEVYRTNFNNPEFTKASKDIVDVTAWVKQVYFDHARYR